MEACIGGEIYPLYLRKTGKAAQKSEGVAVLVQNVGRHICAAGSGFKEVNGLALKAVFVEVCPAGAAPRLESGQGVGEAFGTTTQTWGASR